MRIAIVALGLSATAWIRDAEFAGGRHVIADEVWAINGFGDVLQCERIFHMDDVRIQEARAKSGNNKLRRMLQWMRKHPGPIYTSRPHPDYPGLVDYPLEAVLNSCGYGRAYLNGTVAYAVALAIHEGAREIIMYGCDYAFENASEEGRGCVEYWLGIAAARGIKVSVAASSSLLDTNNGRALYGYDTVLVKQEKDANGNFRLSYAEKTPPTAKEMEDRYNKFNKKANGRSQHSEDVRAK